MKTPVLARATCQVLLVPRAEPLAAASARGGRRTRIVVPVSHAQLFRQGGAVASQAVAGAARDAQVTIVGGGAIGCAVAFALVNAGYSDIQLLERRGIAQATSGQAAGLVGQVRSSVERTRLAMASVELFSRFEAETGYPLDWRQSGSVRIALTDQRVAEFARMAAVADRAGLHVEWVGPARLRELCPTMRLGSVLGALWCPSDGYLQPHSLASGYERAARARGVHVVTNTCVSDVVVAASSVTGVVVDGTRIGTELVIDAAGPWAARLAHGLGIDLPIFPVRHQYAVTRPVVGWTPELAVVRIPDLRLYARAEMCGVLLGGWEPDAVSRDPLALPGFADAPLEPDWDVLARFARDLATLVPGVDEVGVRAVFRGWPAFTPDGRFVVGPVSGLRGFAMAAGCNAHGVSGSAGLAQHLVESLSGAASPYVQSLSPDRFLDGPWERDAMRARAQARYQNYYALTDQPR
jgi:glycine/D-amino acid oxidase-like deaminating enzyme